MARLGTWRLGLKSLRFGMHIAVGLAVLCLLPLAGRRAGRLAGWWYGRFLRILGVRVLVRGRPPAVPVLAIANHVSWMDIPLFGALLDAAFVSKAEVGDWPLVGRFARATGTVFLPRGAGHTRQANERMIAALREGRTVVLFPEATTNAEPVPKHFHARLFAAAGEAGVAVQPVAVHYLPETGGCGHHPLAPWVNEASLARHFGKLFRLRELTVRVTFCTPIAPDGHNRRELARATHAAVARALNPTRPERECPA